MAERRASRLGWILLWIAVVALALVVGVSIGELVWFWVMRRS